MRELIKTDSSESRKRRMQVKGRGTLERRRNSFKDRFFRKQER